MFYKLSTLAKRSAIEKKFALKFKYPDLYNPQPIINGLKESYLPIITAEESNIINFSIWGLLPDAYLDDWDKFQETYNTLNVNFSDVRSKMIPVLDYKEPKRCLIIISGFYTNIIIDGKFKTYHIHLTDHEPFALAGVYNTLADGFYTCAPIIKDQKKAINHVPNHNGMKPVVLKKEDHEKWLDSTMSLSQLYSFIDNHRVYRFKSHPIEAEYYQNNDVFAEVSKNPKLRLVK